MKEIILVKNGELALKGLNRSSFEDKLVKIDEEKNNVRGKECEISTPDSKVKVYIVPTNEELMIARDTMNLVK